MKITDYTPRELVRMIESLEKSVDRLEAVSASKEALTGFEMQLGQKASADQLEALKDDVTKLQESNTWLFRAVVGTAITAVIGSVSSAIVGVLVGIPL